MARPDKLPWSLMQLAYISKRCQNYTEVAQVFGADVRTVEKRAVRERWFQTRQGRYGAGFVECLIGSGDDEHKIKITALFKKKMEITEKIGEKIESLMDILDTITDPEELIALMNSYSKLQDQFQRLVETQARIEAQAETGESAPLTINAPNATVISVRQLIQSSRAAKNEKIP